MAAWDDPSQHLVKIRCCVDPLTPSRSNAPQPRSRRNGGSGSVAGVAAELVPDIEQHRAHLIAVGYRITGNPADAEDAVQEAWLRLAGLDPAARAGLRDVRAWLTTVVGRICLDRLRSATARRCPRAASNRCARSTSATAVTFLRRDASVL